MINKKSGIRKKASLSVVENSKTLDRKIDSDGHILKWVPEENKYVREYRLIFAQHIGKHHSQLKEIHHIDGNIKNNDVANLVELESSDHTSLHSQLKNLAFQLVTDKHILYNKQNKRYELSPLLEATTMENSLGFEHIAIKQNKNICESRLLTNIETEFVRGVKIKIPLIAANMSTVINSKFYIQLYKLGALGILHRADSEENILKSIKEVSKECDIVAGSLGIEKNQFDFCKKMIKSGCNIITIDVAHGYSDVVLSLAKKIKLYSPSTKIIIGNATNPDIIYECYDFIDGLKVGIAQGFACETKNTAGCTEKQFSALLKFKQLSKNFNVPIISDGGTREPADLTKAIAAGANSIMAGSIFAACPESAAEVVLSNGEEKKLYAGMASEYVQNHWKGGLKPGTCAEGGVRLLTIGDPVSKLLEKYSGALRSGITYAGASDINSFQQNVKFVRIH